MPLPILYDFGRVRSDSELFSAVWDDLGWLSGCLRYPEMPCGKITGVLCICGKNCIFAD